MINAVNDIEVQFVAQIVFGTAVSAGIASVTESDCLNGLHAQLSDFSFHNKTLL